MNSLQACKPGASVRVVLQPAGRQATLRVEDTGGGIAPEALRDIFKPYVSGRSDGHGIGLSMVRRLAEAMGWQVEANSQVGQGTIMTIHHIKVHGA
jgi:signal transduction histidine kinase